MEFDSSPRAPHNAPRNAQIPIPRAGLRGSSGILLFFALILASATVGVALCAMRTTSALEVRVAEGISGAASVLLCIHTWRISRRAKGMIPILAVIAGFLAYYCNSLLPAGLLVGLVTGVASGGLLFTIVSKKQAAYIPLIPLLAYGIALLCSWDIVGSAAALLPLPGAAALALSTRRSAESEEGPNRVGVICLTSLFLGLALGGMIALSLYRQLGSLDPQVLRDALDAARESIILRFTSFELPPDTSDALRKLFSREFVEMTVNYVINLLPAIYVVILLLISTMAQLLLHASLVSFGCGESLSDRVREFRMSAVSCVVFAAAYLVYFIVGSTASSTMVGTIAENIYVILTPGLAFSGFLRLLSGMAKRRMGCMSFLVIFILPAALLFSPILLIIVAPILAIVEVFGRFGTFVGRKMRASDDDSSGDNHFSDNDNP